MNSIKRLIVVSFAILAPVFGAYAQQPASPFAGALKTAASIDAGGKVKIQSGVDSLLTSLVAAKPEQGKPFRELLCNEPKPGPGVSTAFQAAYAEAIAAKAPDAFASAKDLQVKLEIAIVIGRVAEYTGSASLEPAVRAVFQEKKSLVFTTWGLRAARFIMPELHKANNSKEMIALVVDTASLAQSGPSFEEAYEALKPPENNPKILPTLADALLTLADLRTKQYEKGIPDDPYLDLKPLNYLGTQYAWNTMTLAQRQRWMQIAINLFVLGGSRADEVKGTGNRAQIVNAINNVCKTLIVVSSMSKNDPNWSTLSQLSNKAVTNTSAIIIPDSLNVAKTVSEIPPTILKIAEYKTLVIPETLEPLK